MNPIDTTQDAHKKREDAKGYLDNDDPVERADARSLEHVPTELARLTAQVRQIARTNRAPRGANETLTDANPGLRQDRAVAQAETADIRTRNVALQATNDAMDSRTADREATVAAACWWGG